MGDGDTNSTNGPDDPDDTNRDSNINTNDNLLTYQRVLFGR